MSENDRINVEEQKLRDAVNFAAQHAAPNGTKWETITENRCEQLNKTNKTCYKLNVTAEPYMATIHNAGKRFLVNQYSVVSSDNVVAAVKDNIVITITATENGTINVDGEIEYSTKAH